MAALVMVVPFLGTIVAFVIAAERGIGAMELGLFFGMYGLTFFGITGGFHRHLAHRAFRTSQPVRWLLAVFACMAGQGPPLFWVATHRLHHALSDRNGDPHSPLQHRSAWGGFFHSHMGWMLTHPGGDLSVWASDLLKDRLMFKIQQQYLFWLLAGLWLPALAGWAISGTAFGAFLGFLWGGLVRSFFVNQFAWTIGSLCHIVGVRPYETRDASRNVLWLTPFTFGESNHNNHHAFPSSAYHGLEWWELDPTALILRALALFGIVWDLKVPSQAVRDAARRQGYSATEVGSEASK